MNNANTMVTESTNRNEILAMNNKYKEVLAWEAEFAQQIEELSKIEDTDTAALEIANQIIQAWEDRNNIRGKKTNLALSSNSKRITRLENKLMTLGYIFTKHTITRHRNGLWYAAISIEKVK